MPASANQFAAARFALELDGVRVGLIAWAEGGEPVGEVVEVSLGPTNVQKKHVTNIRWTPIKLRTGIGMGNELYQWIKAFVGRQGTKKDGAIIAFNAGGKPLSRLEWRGGQIVEVVFPGGDAADRAEGFITLTIQPEATRARDAAQEPRLSAGLKQKAWNRNGFRVAVDGIAQDTRRIVKVDDIVLRQDVTEYRDGGSRFPRIVLGRQHVGDVILTLPDGQANAFAAWAEDFLVQGHSSDGDERDGTLDYLSPAAQPVMTLRFRHLGIYRLARERPAATKNAIAQARACLYCEEIELDRPPTPAPKVAKKRAAPKKAARKTRR